MIFGVIAVAREQFGITWPRDLKLIGKEFEASEEHCALPSLTDLGVEHNNPMSVVPIYNGTHWMTICIQGEDG